jgi:hypothetical protein
MIGVYQGDEETIRKMLDKKGGEQADDGMFKWCVGSVPWAGAWGVRGHGG